nr:MAG TPA: hypothetical protein [Caudoviricetes sp.]
MYIYIAHRRNLRGIERIIALRGIPYRGIPPIIA